MKLALDTTDGAPLTDQLASQIEDLIRSRHLRAGVKLPSIRQLAAEQQISRFPVIEAYDRLASRGLIQPKHGSGYYVTSRADGRDRAAGSTDPRAVEAASGHILSQFDAAADAGAALSSGFVPAAWRDLDGVAQTVRQIARAEPASLIDYTPPQGDAQLRALIAHRLVPLGIDTTAQQVLVTHSATHALDLVVRLLLKPGDTVFVEDPGYFNLFGLLKLQGIRVIGIPRRANGPDTDALEAALAHHRPVAFFVHSALHNPTATNLTPPVAFRMLQLAQQHDFMLVEDDVYADFQALPTQRLAALDQLDRVIYIGGFSKTLSASLRLGYLAARADLVKALVDVKALTSMGGSRLAERVIATLLERGAHRKHLGRLRRRAGEALTQAAALLGEAGWTLYEPPAGGMFAWARAPGVDDSTRLAEAARAHGLRLAPGSEHRPDGAATPWVRLNLAHLQDPRARAFVAAAGHARGGAA